MPETETARPRPETETHIETRDRVRGTGDRDRETPRPGPETGTRDRSHRSAIGPAGPAVSETAETIETLDQLDERASRIQARIAHLVSGPGTDETPRPGALTRRRVRREARRLAEDEAIRRGAEAELLLMEAAAAGELTEEPRPSRWLAFAAGWPQMALTAVVAAMASVGQIQFARETGATGMLWLFGYDITPLFAPAVFDLSVAALYALGMYVAVAYKASPWLCWGAGTGVGAFSVYTNTQHRGALFFAAASAVLIISWLVRMVVRYRTLPHVKARREEASPRLLTSSLVLVDWRLAHRAWVISRRRPLAHCARLKAAAGEQISERDLVIRAAGLWQDVRADRVVAETRDTDRYLQPAEYALAVRRATITAWDAVDRLLGLEVIDRTGIPVAQATYEELPRRSPVPDTVPAEMVEQYGPAARPPRRLPAAPVSPAPSGARDRDVEEVLPLLPPLDEELLADVRRNVGYVRQVVTHFDGGDHGHWATRDRAIGKQDVTAATVAPDKPRGVTGDGTCTRVAQLFGRLREAARATGWTPPR